jgi:hypothetical protein
VQLLIRVTIGQIYVVRQFVFCAASCSDIT